jgi:hypothetical protein
MQPLVFTYCIATVVFFCPAASAQDQVASQPASSAYAIVSGHVTCGDTDKPARFAAVQLIPEKQQQTQNSDWGNVKDSNAMAKLLEKSMAQAQKGTGLSAVTSIDGRFEMPKVPAGTYYIVADLSGYLSPLSTLSTGERMGLAARMHLKRSKHGQTRSPYRALRYVQTYAWSGVVRSRA